ncbi:transcriptional regulator [Halobacteria archaeon HArc-gm2]|nr:transcriptional regulator [Halobacteria archaeon HArc-gm2]
MTTLKVTVGEADRLERETIQRIRAAERGEPLDDDQPVLNFDDYATLAEFLRETNLELLEAIRREGPDSIRAAASLVDRDYREVHRNLKTLESLGLVRLNDDGAGTAKTPIVEYDDIEISISLGEPTDDSQSVTT